MINATPRQLYVREKDTVRTLQEDGLATRLVWAGAENLAPNEIRSQESPAHIQSLYRLRYPGPQGGKNAVLNISSHLLTNEVTMTNWPQLTCASSLNTSQHWRFRATLFSLMNVGYIRRDRETWHKEYVLLNINPLNAELNPICYLLALLRAHRFLHVSRIRVKSLSLRLLMSYIYIYIYIYIWSTYSWCF